MAVDYGSLPFAEQIAFFRDKLNLPTEDYATVYGRQHDRAFIVSGATKLDLIQDFRASVSQMINEGRTLADFKQDFETITARHGWSYRGTPGWRSQVIYDTNLRQSYNAGREQQMNDPALRRRRPYGLYRHSGKEHFRPEHKAWDGVVLLLDDGWWDSHSPQNGYGCGCKKFMISNRDVKRLNLKVREQAPPDEMETRVIGKNGPNPRTVQVPKGIDPGFEHKPGATWHPDLDRVDPTTARQYVAENLRDGVLERWHAFIDQQVQYWRQQPEFSDLEGERQRRAIAAKVVQGEKVPVAVLDDEYRGYLKAKTQVVLLSDDTLVKQILQREGQGIEVAAYQELQRTIAQAQIVLRDRDYHLTIIQRGERFYWAVLKVTQDGKEIYLQSLRITNANQVRRQVERAQVVLKNELW
jgi:hypothetical protein